MTWANYHKTLLALTAYREARSEPIDGIRAVLQVIRNRVKTGWGDWDVVMTKKWQFSSMTAPGDSQLVVWPKAPDAQFELCMNLAEAVYNGSYSEDITRGATFYRNPKTATSQSFQKMIDDGKIEKTTTIGHHDFYKEVTIQ